MFATKIRHAQFLLQRYPSIFSEFPQRHCGQPKVRCFTITLLVKLNEALDGAVLVTKGLFTWREEDARTRRKILDGETTFPWEKFSSVWCSSRERIKHGGRKPQKYNLGPSALFTGVNHNNQLVVTPNEMVGHYCRDYPLNNPQSFFSALSLVLGSYKQRQFIWHLADLSISRLWS